MSGLKLISEGGEDYGYCYQDDDDDDDDDANDDDADDDWMTCKHLDSPPLPLEDLAKVARTGESKQATS